RAQRWDRRLARIAALLLAAGIGLNVLVAWQNAQPIATGSFASHKTSSSIVDFAVAVAESTDVETGKQFAKQLAAMSGTTLTDSQAAEIERQARRRTTAISSEHKEG